MSELLTGEELLRDQRERDPNGLTSLAIAKLDELIGIASAGERYSTLDDPELVVFTAAIGQRNYRYNGRFASVAVVNPNAFPIYLGVRGNVIPGANELLTVDPYGWVVLPIVGDSLTLNSNGQVGNVYVLPFKLAQQFRKGSAAITGNVASGAADSGNPVKVGGRYNATLPTLADGQRGDVQLDPKGRTLVAPAVSNSRGDGVNMATVNEMVDNTGAGRSTDVITYGYIGGSLFDRIRTPNIFKTAVATAAGNTAIWTPTSGKKFRLMGYVIYLTADAKLNAAADLEITFQDNTTAIGIGFSSYVPTALTPGDVTLASGVVQLGNGYLAVAANDVLNVNLSAALTGGEVRVSAWGTEE